MRFQILGIPLSIIFLPNSKKGGKHGKIPLFKENKEGPSKEELKKNKLCFTCQHPWVPRQRCAKGKEHYIEVFYEYDEDDLEG